jgi:hypothetical protein
VIENLVNKEKKYLPACYVVSTWDTKTNELKKTVTHRETWLRLGDYDLPKTQLTVTATSAGMETRNLTLSNHKLLMPQAKK